MENHSNPPPPEKAKSVRKLRPRQSKAASSSPDGTVVVVEVDDINPPVKPSVSSSPTKRRGAASSSSRLVEQDEVQPPPIPVKLLPLFEETQAQIKSIIKQRIVTFHVLDNPEASFCSKEFFLSPKASNENSLEADNPSDTDDYGMGISPQVRDLLRVLSEGSEEPVSELAKRIHLLLLDQRGGGSYILPEEKLKQVLPILLNRKSFGMTQYLNMEVRKLEDQTRECLWIWEAPTLDIFPKEYRESARQSKELRYNISRKLKALVKLLVYIRSNDLKNIGKTQDLIDGLNRKEFEDKEKVRRKKLLEEKKKMKELEKVAKEAEKQKREEEKLSAKLAEKAAKKQLSEGAALSKPSADSGYTHAPHVPPSVTPLTEQMKKKTREDKVKKNQQALMLKWLSKVGSATTDRPSSSSSPENPPKRLNEAPKNADSAFLMDSWDSSSLKRDLPMFGGEGMGFSSSSCNFLGVFDGQTSAPTLSANISFNENESSKKGEDLQAIDSLQKDSTEEVWIALIHQTMPQNNVLTAVGMPKFWRKPSDSSASEESCFIDWLDEENSVLDICREDPSLLASRYLEEFRKNFGELHTQQLRNYSTFQAKNRRFKASGLQSEGNQQSEYIMTAEEVRLGLNSTHYCSDSLKEAMFLRPSWQYDSQWKRPPRRLLLRKLPTTATAANPCLMEEALDYDDDSDDDWFELYDAEDLDEKDKDEDDAEDEDIEDEDDFVVPDEPTEGNTTFAGSVCSLAQKYEFSSLLNWQWQFDGEFKVVDEDEDPLAPTDFLQPSKPKPWVTMYGCPRYDWGNDPFSKIFSEPSLPKGVLEEKDVIQLIKHCHGKAISKIYLIEQFKSLNPHLSKADIYRKFRQFLVHEKRDDDKRAIWYLKEDAANQLQLQDELDTLKKPSSTSEPSRSLTTSLLSNPPSFSPPLGQCEAPPPPSVITGAPPPQIGAREDLGGSVSSLPVKTPQLPVDNTHTVPLLSAMKNTPTQTSPSAVSVSVRGRKARASERLTEPPPSGSERKRKKASPRVGKKPEKLSGSPDSTPHLPDSQDPSFSKHPFPFVSIDVDEHIECFLPDNKHHQERGVSPSSSPLEGGKSGYVSSDGSTTVLVTENEGEGGVEGFYPIQHFEDLGSAYEIEEACVCALMKEEKKRTKKKKKISNDDDVCVALNLQVLDGSTPVCVESFAGASEGLHVSALAEEMAMCANPLEDDIYVKGVDSALKITKITQFFKPRG